MSYLVDEFRSLTSLTDVGRLLKVFLLRAMGARDQRCAYCASTIPVGEAECRSCGAAVSNESAPIDEVVSKKLRWVVPLLLCVVFPPALIVIAPVLFWRWLRQESRGWLLPILICLFFPPAALIVAPALLWRSPNRRLVT